MVGILPIYGDEWGDGLLLLCQHYLLSSGEWRERFGARGIPIPIPYRFPYTNEQMIMTSMTITKWFSY